LSLFPKDTPPTDDPAYLGGSFLSVTDVDGNKKAVVWDKDGNEKK
jgi:hypothetical protein